MADMPYWAALVRINDNMFIYKMNPKQVKQPINYKKWNIVWKDKQLQPPKVVITGKGRYKYMNTFWCLSRSQIVDLTQRLTGRECHMELS